MERIAITGASGKIASALIESYRKYAERNHVVLLLISSVDLAPVYGSFEGITCIVASSHDIESYRRVLKEFRPTVIINTIGYTDVDGCETNRALAQHLNVQFPEFLARYARTFDVHLLHYSTDYVFDGKAGPYDEHQTPNPINYYGKTKLAGENAIRSLVPTSSTIVRTNVVYGFGGNAKADFVEWVTRQCRSNLPVRAAIDQYSNPTTSWDIAYATMELIRRKQSGLYHVGGADYCSRYDFALAIARVFDLRNDLILPVTTVELNLPALRPLRGGLVPIRLETELGLRFSGIEEGLTVYRNKMNFLKK